MLEPRSLCLEHHAPRHHLHHPDLLVSWGKVGIELSTHAIGGLSENDFILAAKIDTIA